MHFHEMQSRQASRGALDYSALELPGAACAAMEFEPSTGRPTFRLRPGSPGGSEALALARRMNPAPAWIAGCSDGFGPGPSNGESRLDPVNGVSFTPRPYTGGKPRLFCLGMVEISRQPAS